MAHFAQIDENNIVIQVIVVANEDILDADGQESEEVGIAFCKSLLGEHTRWVQTSYNNNFRGMFAGVGAYYDALLDVFVGEEIEVPDISSLIMGEANNAVVE